MIFGEELEQFTKVHPYKKLTVDGVEFRYVLAGDEDKPALVFLNGLNMQEMWIRYVEAFKDNMK